MKEIKKYLIWWAAGVMRKCVHIQLNCKRTQLKREGEEKGKRKRKEDILYPDKMLRVFGVNWGNSERQTPTYSQTERQSCILKVCKRKNEGNWVVRLRRGVWGKSNKREDERPPQNK